jgi:hypothetical protein
LQEGDIQVTIPYEKCRQALEWIRRTHRTLTVDEFVTQTVEARPHTIEAIKRSQR